MPWMPATGAIRALRHTASDGGPVRPRALWTQHLLSRSSYESTNQDAPWRVLAITALFLSLLCISASGIALVKLSLKRYKRYQARRRLRVQSTEGQAGRMLRLSERAVSTLYNHHGC